MFISEEVIEEEGGVIHTIAYYGPDEDHITSTIETFENPEENTEEDNQNEPDSRGEIERLEEENLELKDRLDKLESLIMDKVVQRE